MAVRGAARVDVDRPALGQTAIAFGLILGFALALAAPPALQTDVATAACAEAEKRGQTLTAQWTISPLPHWTCVDGEDVVVHLGWWL